MWVALPRQVCRAQQRRKDLCNATGSRPSAIFGGHADTTRAIDVSHFGVQDDWYFFKEFEQVQGPMLR